jgi:heme/copper-type cytochrome/quinol oxidase subunit 4
LANKSYLGGIISLLLGLSIGFTLLAFVYTFISYFPHSFLQATIFAFFATIPGLIVIVLLEFIILNYEKYEEQKRQTKLMEALLEELKVQKEQESQL